MTTQALFHTPQLSLNMPIGNGRRKTVELPRKDIHPALVIAEGEFQQASESYRQAADNLLRNSCWRSRRIFITSPIAGDGKTCTAFNLASALSSRGKSVLVTELSFIKPTFRNLLGGIRIWNGLDCALRGTTEPADTIFSMAENGPDVCAVRDSTPITQIRQLLPGLDHFLEWAGKRYDWVLLDCPPVLSPEWNSWFREHVGPTLLVVREQHTPLVDIRKATTVLGANLKGLLLNESSTRSA
jgi:Mrp family chromosome partitioning ATPase